MSLLGATILTAYATLALAILALATAIFAGLAFRKQAQEVRAIERQVADDQELTRQQAELIRIQTGQLAALEGQLGEQRKASAAQSEVLRLQAAELSESLEERRRETEDRRRGQAASVTAWLGERRHPVVPSVAVGAVVSNASGLPVFDVRVFFHQIKRGGDGWVPVGLGGPSPDETTPLIPPADECFAMFPATMWEVLGDIRVSADTVAVSIEFTDAAGNRWERDPRGALIARS